jgi:hypothetical protein
MPGQLLGGTARLCYTHQNIAEFWNVWTRPADKNGFGLSCETAEIEIGKFETMMEFVPDSPAVYKTWREVVRDSGLSAFRSTMRASSPRW